MTPAEMGIQVKRELGRPDDDDRFSNGDIDFALQDAERAVKRMLAAHDHARKRILQVLSPITTNDGGATYTLTAAPIYLELWTPPGPNGGMRLYPAARGNRRDGFYVIDNKVYMSYPKVWTPGLYPYGIFDTASIDWDAQTPAASSLPSGFHKLQVLEAAYDLASRPFTRLDARSIRDKADLELSRAVRAEVFATPGSEYEYDPNVEWWHSPDLEAS